MIDTLLHLAVGGALALAAAVVLMTQVEVARAALRRRYAARARFGFAPRSGRRT